MYSEIGPTSFRDDNNAEIEGGLRIQVRLSRRKNCGSHKQPPSSSGPTIGAIRSFCTRGTATSRSVLGDAIASMPDVKTMLKAAPYIRINHLHIVAQFEGGTASDRVDVTS